MGMIHMVGGFVVGAALALLLKWREGRAHRRRLLLVLLFSPSFVLDSMKRFGIKYPYALAATLRDEGLIEGLQCVSLTERGRAMALRLL